MIERVIQSIHVLQEECFYSVDIFVLFHIFILVNRSLPLSICAFILEKQETPTYTDLIYIYIVDILRIILLYIVHYK